MEWTTEKKMLKKVCVSIPEKIVSILKYIESKLENKEFSILLKTLRTEYDEDKMIIVIGEEYYIPKQIVSYAHIKYEPDPVGDTYNVIIHKHPSRSGFSDTDEEMLNNNCDVSLIYSDGSFCAGIVNVKINNAENCYLQLRVSNYGFYSKDFEQIDLSNIKTMPEPYNYTDYIFPTTSNRSLKKNQEEKEEAKILSEKFCPSCLQELSYLERIDSRLGGLCYNCYRESQWEY